MREYFRNLGKINLSLIIKKGKEKLGDEVGFFFIAYKHSHSTEIVINIMKNKKYDNRMLF